jgi:raffinose/stachyose/melibiose transport system permease protein
MSIDTSRSMATTTQATQVIRAKKRRSGGHAVFIAAMLLPSLIFIVAFSYYPAVQALRMSLFQWDGFNAPTFVGFQNFTAYIHNPNFLLEVKNITFLTVGSLIISFTAPLWAAEIIFNFRSERAANIYKRLIVIPMVIPFIVTVEIWAYIYNPQIGMLNSFFREVHLNFLTNTWLGNPRIAIWCILFVGFPWVSGLNFLIYLAGLQSISSELFDSFVLESTSVLVRVRHLDLPLIRGQIRLVGVLTIVVVIQGFVNILILTNGGPGNATMVPGLEMYFSAFQYDEYGLGMAIGSLLFVTILVITFVVNRIIKAEE